jgi:hypothetical protein
MAADPDPDLAKAASLSHQVAALRIGCDQPDMDYRRPS